MPRMSPSRKYLIKKARVRSSGFPIATIAYYGPDDQFASKMTVGILDSYENIIEMKRWFSEGDVDVRLDEAINQQIVEFLQEYDVYRVAMVDRIIGCPHEEGIDYPEGENCPECPFWADRDRWTGELLQ